MPFPAYLVGGVLLDQGLHVGVAEQGLVGGQQQAALLGLEDVLKVVVGELEGLLGPGALKAAAVLVGAAERVGAGEDHNVLVRQAHAVEDVAAQVLGALGVWEMEGGGEC